MELYNELNTRLGENIHDDFIPNVILVHEGARLSYLYSCIDEETEKILLDVCRDRICILRRKKRNCEFCFIILKSNRDEIIKLLDSDKDGRIGMGRALGYPYIITREKSVEPWYVIDYLIKSNDRYIKSNDWYIKLYGFVLPRSALTNDLLNEVIKTRDLYSRILGTKVNVRIRIKINKK